MSGYLALGVLKVDQNYEVTFPDWPQHRDRLHLEPDWGDTAVQTRQLYHRTSPLTSTVLETAGCSNPDPDDLPLPRCFSPAFVQFSSKCLSHGSPCGVGRELKRFLQHRWEVVGGDKESKSKNLHHLVFRFVELQECQCCPRLPPTCSWKGSKESSKFCHSCTC